jgi:hypothetical protein
MKREDGSVVDESVFVGLCEHGKARAIIWDDLKRPNGTADFVADMIRRGLNVRHVSGEAGRESIQFECLQCDEVRGWEGR